MPLQVELVSPERILFSGEADMVVARTSSGGDIAFMPGHAPFLGELGIGAVQLHMSDGSVQRAAVHGGFLEVSDDRVEILSDVAELPAEIDRARAEAARERAQAQLGSQHDAEAEAALRRAHVRIELAAA